MRGGVCDPYYDLLGLCVRRGCGYGDAVSNRVNTQSCATVVGSNHRCAVQRGCVCPPMKSSIPHQRLCAPRRQVGFTTAPMRYVW